MNAKRLDAGWYEYRGHQIKDHGRGSAVKDAMARYSGRWLIYRGLGNFPIQIDRAATFADAKSKVDSLSAPKLEVDGK